MNYGNDRSRAGIRSAEVSFLTVAENIYLIVWPRVRQLFRTAGELFPRCCRWDACRFDITWRGNIADSRVTGNLGFTVAKGFGKFLVFRLYVFRRSEVICNFYNASICEILKENSLSCQISSREYRPYLGRNCRVFAVKRF